LGSARVGDQIGTMLAGTFALTSDKAVSFDAARSWVEQQEWDDTTSADATRDERRLLDFLMQQMGELDHGGNRREKMTLGEMVKLATGPNGDAVASVANTELKRHGIWFDGHGIWIANDHAQLKKHLEGTPWASKWDRALKRLPGAVSLRRTAAAISFAGGRSRATFLPIEMVT
jgi:putative DNA primase/helicase